MNRFFVSPDKIDIENMEIIICDEDTKHISRVLRMVKGDFLEVCDGEKNEYIAEIINMGKNEILLKIREQGQANTEPEIDAILYQSIPKSSKMDLIIQKSTELGVGQIVPVITERTIVQFKNQKDVEKKTDRWQKVAEEAAKQSKRGIIPHIHRPINYGESLKHGITNDYNIIAYEKEKDTGIKNIIESIKTYKGKKIGIWVGPEGGFTIGEIDSAMAKNLKSFSLGPRILRTETAGFTILSILMYELGDLGG